MADDAAASNDEQGEVDQVDQVGDVQPDATETEAAAVDDEADGEAAADDPAEDLAGEDVEDDEDDEAEDFPDDGPVEPRISHVRLATIVGLVAVLALAGLSGWLGFRAYHSHQADDQRKVFLEVGRQGAINLTTIDFEHADDDVKRILESATGNFYDEFQQRAQPFLDVVKQVKSKSVGRVTEAGIESVSDDEAQVLVAVAVNTTVVGQPDQRPRAWRMRISVQKVGADTKVSNVEFVP